MSDKIIPLLIVGALFAWGLATAPKVKRAEPPPPPSPPPPPPAPHGEKPPSSSHAPPWNPPPPGRPLRQPEVTGPMGAFAVETLHSDLPMHSVSARTFPEGAVLARVEWHTLQARTGKSFPEGIRGVSLYWGAS